MVIEDPVRGQHISTKIKHLNMPLLCRYTVTDRLHIDRDSDIIVIPVDFATQALRYPFISYGKAEMLNIAIAGGCFDYLKEPWNCDELIFRVERLAEHLISKSGSLRLINFQLLYEKKRVSLTDGERRLMKVLLANAGGIVSREALFYSLWGEISKSKSRVVDVHISSLRKKIRDIMGIEDRDIIISEKGLGYRLELDDL